MSDRRDRGQLAEIESLLASGADGRQLSKQNARHRHGRRGESIVGRYRFFGVVCVHPAEWMEAVGPDRSEAVGNRLDEPLGRIDDVGDAAVEVCVDDQFGKNRQPGSTLSPEADRVRFTFSQSVDQDSVGACGPR